jgi:hypothetical protein
MGIAASIVLLAAGLVLAYALDIDQDTLYGVGVDWVAIGYILLAAGVIGLIWCAAAMISRRDERVEIREIDRDL